MQVTQEPLDPCQVALTIEVESDKVVDAVAKAYREYAKHVSVPGFRKGKAPMSFVRQRVPESDVRQRTAELLVEPAYEEALRSNDIIPVAPPKLELLQLDLQDKPFVFKAVVPLAPVVEVGTYKGVSVERSVSSVTEADVDEQLQRLQERSAEFPIVERAAEQGDVIVGDVSAIVEGNEDASTPRPTMVELNENNIAGFNEQVVGIAAGETRSFPLSYPEDYPEETLAGKTAEFTITVKEVRAKEVPALDDALAVKLTNGQTQTLEELRSNLRGDMERQLAENVQQQLEGSVIDKVLETATVKFPPQFIDAEVDAEVRQLLERLEREQVQPEQYLNQIGKTQEQFFAELRAAAERRITVGLLLGKVYETEGMDVTDEDRQAAIAERAAQQRTSPAAMRAFLEANNGMQDVDNRARTKKVLDFLLTSAIINDTEAADVQEEAQPEEAKVTKPKAPKRSTKTKASDTE